MEKKIDFDQEPKSGLGNGPITDAQGAQLTLKDLCVQAVVGVYDDERPSGKEKKRRADLAKKIFGGGVVALNQNDLEILKTLVGKGYPPIIVGSVWDILEGEGYVAPAPKLVEAPAAPEAAPVQAAQES